jgi:hypothetical protein
LAARPQCQPHKGQLALHNPKCTYQTQAPLPFNLTESGDYVNRSLRATAVTEFSPVVHNPG